MLLDDPKNPARLSPPDRARRLSLRIPGRSWELAARIGRDYSGRRLETVIAALLADLAVAAERPDSWEYERVSAWLSSHVWEVEPKDEAPRLREDEVMGSRSGAYPWDGWEQWALGQGVAKDLAALGRAVIREAWQHGWPPDLRSLCGWRDDGRRMARLALRRPALAQARWQSLLDTDGGRWSPQASTEEAR